MTDVKVLIDDAKNPNDNNKYENWENGGMTLDDIKIRLDWIKYNPTILELYRNAILLLDDMESRIANSRDIPCRIDLAEEKNCIRKLKNDLKATVEILPKAILENATKVTEKELDEMAKLINEIEDKHLKYLRWQLSHILLTGMVENSVEKEIDEYGKLTCKSNGSLNPKDLFVEFTYQQGWYYTEKKDNNGRTIKRELNIEHPVHVNTKDKEFIIDYTNSSDVTKSAFLNTIYYAYKNWKYDPSYDYLLRWTLSMGTDGTIVYKTVTWDYMHEWHSHEVDLLPLWEWVTIQEKIWYDISEDYKENAEERQRNKEQKENLIISCNGLDKESFKRDFEWDSFKQGQIWNCWMLSFLDSFVNFWDYELLIRTNVEKNKNGWYDIYLPMWYPPNNNKRGTCYSITDKDLNLTQLNQDQMNINYMEWKIWHRCLVCALAKECTTGTNGVPDYAKLQAWIWAIASELLLDNNSFWTISFMDKQFTWTLEEILSNNIDEFKNIFLKFKNGEYLDATLDLLIPDSVERNDFIDWILSILNWETLREIKEKSSVVESALFPAVNFIYNKYIAKNKEREGEFYTIFTKYLTKFNKDTDMMTVTVLRNDKRENVDDRSKFKGTPHVLSVDNVYTKEGKYYVQLSNPHNAGAKRGDENYIPPISLQSLISKCPEFTFVSNDKEKIKSYEDSSCKVTEETMKILKKMNIWWNRWYDDFNTEHFNGLGKPKEYLWEAWYSLWVGKDKTATLNRIGRTPNLERRKYTNRRDNNKKVKLDKFKGPKDLITEFNLPPEATVTFKDNARIDTKAKYPQNLIIVVDYWWGKKEEIYVQLEISTDGKEINIEKRWRKTEWVGDYYLISSYGNETFCGIKWPIESPKYEYIIWDKIFHVDSKAFDTDWWAYRFANFINVLQNMKQVRETKEFRIEDKKLVLEYYDYRDKSGTINFNEIWIKNIENENTKDEISKILNYAYLRS